MSLAPLYPDLANDLHVRTATVLHQGFPWLQPAWEKLAIFRVPANVLDFKSFSRMIRIELRCNPSCRDHGYSHFHSASSALTGSGLYHHNTRTFGRLLGPCFKTGGMRSFGTETPHVCSPQRAAPLRPRFLHFPKACNSLAADTTTPSARTHGFLAHSPSAAVHPKHSCLP